MSKTKTFFLVDDDIDDHELFYEAIATLDRSYRCMSAYNGEEALQKLEYYLPETPDYIFLDLNMPRLNGKQCLAQIKKINALANVPVVIYSTSSLPDDIKETNKLGATFFITKPDTFNEICKVIYQVLNIDTTDVNRIFHIKVH